MPKASYLERVAIIVETHALQKNFDVLAAAGGNSKKSNIFW